MRPVKCILVAPVILSTTFPVHGVCETFRDCQQRLKAASTVDIYVADIVNDFAYTTVDAGTVTGIVKRVLADRTSPKFSILASESQGDIVFGRKIVEHLSKKQASVTPTLQSCGFGNRPSYQRKAQLRHNTEERGVG